MSQGVARVFRARSRMVAGAGLLAIASTVTGCSEGREPQAIQSYYSEPAQAATPSPTPSVPTAPVRPPEMERTDDVGAVAAARYFIELFAYAMASGDLVEWDAVSTEGCTFCANVHEDVATRYADGGAFTGGGLQSFAATAGPVNQQVGGYPVSVSYTIGDGAEVDATGAVVADMPEGSGTVVIDVLPAVDGWRLVELSTDPALSVFAQ